MSVWQLLGALSGSVVGVFLAFLLIAYVEHRKGRAERLQRNRHLDNVDRILADTRAMMKEEAMTLPEPPSWEGLEGRRLVISCRPPLGPCELKVLEFAAEELREDGAVLLHGDRLRLWGYIWTYDVLPNPVAVNDQSR